MNFNPPWKTTFWYEFATFVLYMKKALLLTIFIASVSALSAQKVDSIYFHLYTDSLKKGQHNYINVDGLLSNGNYIPLDTTDIIFWASDGKFYGNTLLIDKDFKKEKVHLKITLRKNPSLAKEFTMFIKKKEDNEKLKTTEELMRDLQNSKVKKKA